MIDVKSTAHAECSSCPWNWCWKFQVIDGPDLSDIWTPKPPTPPSMINLNMQIGHAHFWIASEGQAPAFNHIRLGFFFLKKVIVHWLLTSAHTPDVVFPKRQSFRGELPKPQYRIDWDQNKRTSWLWMDATRIEHKHWWYIINWVRGGTWLS